MGLTVGVWLAVSILFEVFGDVVVKRASVGGGWPMWALAAIAYNAMLFAWFAAVRSARVITIPGIIWLLAGQVALVVVGCGLFRERISGWQVTGAMIAMPSLLLLSIGGGDGR